MKKILLLIPFIFWECSSNRDEKCYQTWEIREWAESYSPRCTGWSESETAISSQRFECEEVSGINEGQKIHLSKRDTDCTKSYRRYIKRVN